jgi:hypothetical protein
MQQPSLIVYSDSIEARNIAKNLSHGETYLHPACFIRAAALRTAVDVRKEKTS